MITDPPNSFGHFYFMGIHLQELRAYLRYFRIYLHRAFKALDLFNEKSILATVSSACHGWNISWGHFVPVWCFGAPHHLRRWIFLGLEKRGNVFTGVPLE